MTYCRNRQVDILSFFFRLPELPELYQAAALATAPVLSRALGRAERERERSVVRPLIYGSPNVRCALRPFVGPSEALALVSFRSSQVLLDLATAKLSLLCRGDNQPEAAKAATGSTSDRLLVE